MVVANFLENKSMFEKLSKIISFIDQNSISEERKMILNPLAAYINRKIASNEEVRLNFICTHNSRRSHLSQIWAQTMAFHFGIKNIFCYSGGTEATAMFPKVVETLTKQGFEIQKLSTDENPVYAVKYDENQHPIICFSKTYSNDFNPKNNFAAVMTCSNADVGCPMVFGAEVRFAVKYEDPKLFDGTDFMNQKYEERSQEIANEMYYVFSIIKK
jgi:arsenate reductase (thioredoxin)